MQVRRGRDMGLREMTSDVEWGKEVREGERKGGRKVGRRRE